MDRQARCDARNAIASKASKKKTKTVSDRSEKEEEEQLETDREENRVDEEKNISHTNNRSLPSM